jgi:hypothetical protein
MQGVRISERSIEDASFRGSMLQRIVTSIADGTPLPCEKTSL